MIIENSKFPTESAKLKSISNLITYHLSLVTCHLLMRLKGAYERSKHGFPHGEPNTRP